MLYEDKYSLFSCNPRVILRKARSFKNMPKMYNMITYRTKQRPVVLLSADFIGVEVIFLLGLMICKMWHVRLCSNTTFDISNKSLVIKSIHLAKIAWVVESLKFLNVLTKIAMFIC